MMQKKIVKHVQQICERSVLENEKNRIYVEMERQISEKIVRIVKRMCESVRHFVEMEKQKKQKAVGIVRKTYENVARHVEMERQRNEKTVRIVMRM